jgi:acetyl esterase
MASTEDVRIGTAGLRLRIHRPTLDADLPALLYCHGGGWTVFSLDTHDRLMREYAARSGCAVVGIDYSLSPEVRFPHALGEVRDAVEWVAANGTEHGIDPALLALGGDSAGGNLALATAMALRDSGRPLLSALLVNYGAIDDVERTSYARFGGDGYMLTPSEMAEFWVNYRAGERGPDPRARPLLGRFEGLPPTFLCIAECDILADENRELGVKLAAANVDVEMRVYRGATHSFLEAAEVSPLARRALDEASAWLRAVLAR